MARNKQDAFKQAQFVNYTLSKSEVARLRKWFTEHFNDRDWLSDVTQDGYKISFSFDERTKTSACWFIPRDPDGENGGMILSGRGGNPTSALVECVFKHCILFDKRWPSPDASGETWTWDKED